VGKKRKTKFGPRAGFNTVLQRKITLRRIDYFVCNRKGGPKGGWYDLYVLIEGSVKKK